MFEDLFQRRKLNKDKLIEYGFEEQAGKFYYKTNILSQAFLLSIVIDRNGAVDTALVESDSGEEYILYKTNAVGAYVGKVRAEVEGILADISQRCYDLSIFKFSQTQRIIEYVRKEYGDELEFLWARFPDNAVWRRQDNAKWYGVILTVRADKLGLAAKDMAEIIDLRTHPDKMEELLLHDGYYPGWHMNKKHWYSVILDGTVDDDEIFSQIAESYRIAGKSK